MGMGMGVDTKENALWYMKVIGNSDFRAHTWNPAKTEPYPLNDAYSMAGSKLNGWADGWDGDHMLQGLTVYS